MDVWERRDGAIAYAQVRGEYEWVGVLVLDGADERYHGAAGDVAKGDGAVL